MTCAHTIPRALWLVLLLAAILLAGPASADPQQALELVAQHQDVPLEYLEIEAEATVEFTLQDLVLQEYKVADVRPSGGSFAVLIDEQGEVRDGDELRRTERLLAEDSESVKFDREQFEEWLARGAEPRWITVWLSEPAYDQPDRPEADRDLTAEEVAEVEAAVLRHRARFVQWTTAPFLDRLRELVDHDVHFELDRDVPFEPESETVQYDLYSPAVHVKGGPDLLLELAELDEVEFVYLTEQYEPQMAEARYSVRTGYLESTYGLTGRNVRVGLIEHGPVARSQWLRPVDNGLGKGSHLVDPHATAMAGIIASRHPRHRGVAPDAILWNSAIPSLDFASASVLDRAARFGSRVINMSVSGESKVRQNATLAVRAADDLVHKSWITVVAAAGNQNPSTGSHVTAPGNAYNAITVGAYLNGGTRDWSDDRLAAMSAFINPPSQHNDRHKPEVVAPGGQLVSLDAGGNPATVAGGTSNATAMVSGTVAVLMEAKPLLRLWPEANKAILMATAWNDTDGNRNLRSAEGAGGIDGYRARLVASQTSSQGSWGGLKYYNHAPKNLQLTQIYLERGKTVRFAVAWSNPHGVGAFQIPYDWHEPALDLDLFLFGPDGPRVASSSSFDSNNEIVEFTPEKTGWYRVEVKRYRLAGPFPPEDRFLAWAWYQDR